jgi:hypothetical protein
MSTRARPQDRFDRRSPPHAGPGAIGRWSTIALLLVGCAGKTPPPQTPTRVLLLAAEGARPLVERVRRPYLELTVRDPAKALAAIADEDAPAPEPGPAEVARRCQEVLEGARRAYRELDFGGAVTRLAGAEAELVATAHRPAHFSLLAKIVFWRGLSHLARGEDDAAEQAVRWALALGHPPPAGKHAPEIERFVGRVAAAESPTGAVLLVMQPADATVLLDGKPQQRPADDTPLRLTAGLHHLRLERIGHRGRGLVRLVAAGKVDRLELTLDRLDPPATAAAVLTELQHSGEPPAQPDLLRQLLDDDAWLLQREGPPPAATVLWLGDGRKPALRCSGEETPLADCLARGIYGLATGKEPPPAPVASKPVYRRWWFWTAVAAVAAGAGVGIYFGTRSGSDGTDVDIGLLD